MVESVSTTADFFVHPPVFDFSIEPTNAVTGPNRQIFPTYISETRAIHKDSVIARIKERRRQMRKPTQRQALAPSSTTNLTDARASGPASGGAQADGA